jgi:transcriptional regulator with XRE-family HTH domain
MITEEEITTIVAENLTSLRKDRGLTQRDVAEKLSYSDKSVSKWERGELLPDLATLQELANFYGVTIDFLTHKPTPDNVGLYSKDTAKQDAINRHIICSLIIVAIWTLAIVAYAAVRILHIDERWYPWMAFIWAIPATFAVLTYYGAKHNYPTLRLASSIICGWSMLIAAYLEIGFDFPDSKGWNLGFLFILGIPITIATVLYSRIKKKNN